MDPAAPSCAVQKTVPVVLNEQIARDTFRLRLEFPELARSIRPGQFVMIRGASGSDPLLGRPFALYDMVRGPDDEPSAVDIVYLVLGRGTKALAERRPGDAVVVWGPLGNGFGPAPEGPVHFVAGGIGQTPFLALARWWLGQEQYGGLSFSTHASSATLIYGVRTAALLAGLDDFRRAGVGVEITTDDGSSGRRGFVTGLFRERLERGERPAKVVGCGPPPMLGALAELAAEFDLDCDLSLENHMACGFGACFSCVAPIRQEDGSVDLRRVCVEGPIFPARDVVLGRSH